MGVVSQAGRSLPALGPLPLNARVLNIGDSRTHLGTVTVGNDRFYTEGFTNRIDHLAGSKFRIPAGYNLGIPGETVVNFVDNRLAEIPSDIDLVRILISTNDFGLYHRTAAEVIAKFTLLRDTILAKNDHVRISWICEPPRFDGALTPEDQEAQDEVNAWIEAQASNPRILVTRTSSMTADHFKDRLHFNNLGQGVLGGLVRETEAPWRPAASAIDEFFGGPVSALNPTFAGNTGRIGNITGVMADDTSAHYGGGGVTIEAAKDADDRQVFAFSGTPTSDGILFVNMYGAIKLPLGSICEGMFVFRETEPLVNIAAIALRVAPLNYSFNEISSATSYWPLIAAESPNMLLELGEQNIYRTPPLVSPGGVAAVLLQFRVLILDTGGAPVSGAVTLELAGARVLAP